MDCDLTAEAYSNLATNELVRHGFDVSKLINVTIILYPKNCTGAKVKKYFISLHHIKERV